jgi:hypothetical protein
VNTEAAPQIDQELRDKATRVTALMVDQAFEGRTGHGGGPCSYRNLTRQELQAYLIIAFEYGSQWESRR